MTPEDWTKKPLQPYAATALPVRVHVTHQAYEVIGVSYKTPFPTDQVDLSILHSLTSYRSDHGVLMYDNELIFKFAKSVTLLNRPRPIQHSCDVLSWLGSWSGE